MRNCVIAVVAMVAFAAGATQYTWKGGTGTVDGWNTSSNWEPAGVPNAGDTAVFNNSVNISSAININGLIRIAFSAVPNERLPEVFANVAAAIADLADAKPARKGKKTV